MVLRLSHMDRHEYKVALLIFIVSLHPATAQKHTSFYQTTFQSSVLQERIDSDVYLDPDQVLAYVVAHKFDSAMTKVSPWSEQALIETEIAPLQSDPPKVESMSHQDSMIRNTIDHRNESRIITSRASRKIFGRKLKIPPGTAMAMAVQMNRPNILPGLFFQGDAIVMNAVIATPMWFELDTFVDHVYEQSSVPKPSFDNEKPNKPHAAPPKPGKPTHPPPDKPGPKSFDIGTERCYLYEHAENFIAATLEVPPSVAQACLARMICEMQIISSLNSRIVNSSVLLELARLVLSPSLATEECSGPYALAEKAGRKGGTCQRFNSACPVSLLNIVIANIFT